jgi:uncharacterized protein YndB with AHSA1/START domain
MIELDERVLVARPRDAVYTLLADVQRLPLWLPPIREATLIDAPAAVGSRLRLAIDGPGNQRIDAAGELTELRPPDRIAFRTVQAPVELAASLDLVAITPTQTQLQLRARIGLPGLLRFAEGMVRKRIEDERGTTLAELVARVEAAIPAPAG